MTQTTNTNRGQAFAIVLMFLTAMAAVWVVYSSLFNQGLLTFFVTLIYIPTVGVIATFLYRHLKRKL